MVHTRATIRDRALATVDHSLPDELLDDVTTDEVEAALDEYQQELNLEGRAAFVGDMLVTSEILRRVMIERGILFEYATLWPNPQRADWLRSLDSVPDEDKNRLIEDIEESNEEGPDGYVDLVEGYVDLTDSLLDELSYVTHGDPVADETVRIVCEHAGQQFETTLETEDDRVDVDGLGEFLDRIVAETTDDDRRFCWTGVSGDLIDVGNPARVGVWFLEGDACKTLDTYFSRARNSVRA